MSATRSLASILSAGCLRCLVYGQPAENEIRYLFWNELAQRFLEDCVDLKDQEADYKD